MDIEKVKLKNLILHSELAFQTNNNVHINARTATEVLCKLMILKCYGKKKGTAILYQEDREWNSRLKVTKTQQGKSHLMNLNMLIKVCISTEMSYFCYHKEYQDKELSEIIRHTITYLKSVLFALNGRGNSAAHESHRKPLYAETTQSLLREVLEWLFQDFLKIDIPSELMPYIGTYDIFISYRHSDEVWVEVLRKNLVSHGYKLFIDNYQLIAGENTKKSLRNAIKRSRNAMIIYPEKDDSLWMKNELEWIEEKKDEESNFKSIPIVIHKSKNLPHGSINYTNFTNQDYAQAFNQLLCSLEHVPPSENHIKYALELPNTPDQFVNEVMEDLEKENVVILFSQEFSEIKRYYSPIKEELKRKFKENFYTLSIPSLKNGKKEKKKEKKYFTSIAESCDMEESVESLQEWKIAMQKKLSTGEEILLLISDLDNGNEECNLKFASALRSLCYQFNDNLYVVLVGHKELAKLVFQEADLSPLRSIGKYLFFPYDPSPIPYEKVELIMSQPIILKDNEYLLKLLEKTKVQRFSPWPYEELVNYLSWKGILIDKDGYYVWRTEELRKIIKEIVNYAKI